IEMDEAGPASPPHAQERFELLQERLVPLWHSIESLNEDEQTIVVIPSISIDTLEGTSLAMQPFEERYLFLLLLLRQPRARMIYVTSQPINPNVVEYYLGLLPGVIPSHARARLFTVPVLDGTPRPLSVKLLERPRLIERIRELIPDPTRAHLVPYNTTTLERDLAVRLGIPMYGADPRFFALGTKTGSRRIFEEEGVCHPLGVENLFTLDDVVDAVIGMRQEKPSLSQVIVKLNEGVSGEGNAFVDLSTTSERDDDAERAAVRASVEAMEFELEDATYPAYVAKLAE